MVNQINRNLDVVNVLSRAEREITGITGVRIKLKIQVAPKKVNEKTIRKACCEAFNVSWEDITGNSRKRPIPDARHTYYWLCATILGQTLDHIGLVANRDHTTVSHGRYKVNRVIGKTFNPLGVKVREIKNFLVGI
jgi:chromosomal replication initiation ATPase DnaA